MIMIYRQILYFVAIGGSSNDFGNDDAVGFHGISRLLVSSVRFPIIAIPFTGEQIGREARA